MDQVCNNFLLLCILLPGDLIIGKDMEVMLQEEDFPFDLGL